MNRTKYFILFSLTVAVLSLLISAKANPSAEFMNSSFEPIIEIGSVNSIEAWEQPKTKYTPKNLRSEYQVRYNGTDKNGKGAYSYTTHFTDYDTYITGSELKEDGKYYITDNTGKSMVTGEHVDLTPINNQMSAMDNRINDMQNSIQRQDFRMNKLEDKMKKGFATVSALTALHPNPRSNEKLEVSLGTGIYADTCAGAIGLFYHPNNRVMVSAGASYGGDNSFAGNVGITFSIGRKSK